MFEISYFAKVHLFLCRISFSHMMASIFLPCSIVAETVSTQYEPILISVILLLPKACCLSFFSPTCCHGKVSLPSSIVVKYINLFPRTNTHLHKRRWRRVHCRFAQAAGAKTISLRLPRATNAPTHTRVQTWLYVSEPLVWSAEVILTGQSVSLIFQPQKRSSVAHWMATVNDVC